MQKKSIAQLITVASFASLAVSAQSQVLFDSNGFEAPSYSLGNLTGQNGFVQDGTAAYTVQNTVAASGSQAVQVGGGAGTDWAYVTQATPWSSTATPGVDTLEIQASIARNLSPTASFGYAIDVYNGLTARTFRFGLVANAGVIQPFVTSRFNGTTGLFDATSAVTNVIVGGPVTADTFVNFKAYLNYTTKRVDLFINGSSVTNGLTIPFADLTASDFSDADLQVSTATGATDRGFFDNVKVTAVPEPASMAALGLGIFGLVSRKRRSRSA